MPEHSAGITPGEFFVLIDDLAIDEDIVNTLGQAVGIAVSGGVTEPVKVKKNQISVKALVNKAFVFTSRDCAARPVI